MNIMLSCRIRGQRVCVLKNLLHVDLCYGKFKQALNNTHWAELFWKF